MNILVGLLASLLAAVLPSQKVQMVRVGLPSSTSAIAITSATPFNLTLANGTAPVGPYTALAFLPHPNDRSWDVILPTPRGPQSFDVEAGNLTGGSSLVVTHEATNATATYRGVLEFHAAPQGFSLIDVLDLDDYLKGVVPSEVPASFPAEALKAMAVVTRTYTLAHLGRHHDQGYDLCSTTHCQVYRGQNQEASATSAAVEATRGQILTLKGQPIDAMFSACCGGHGEGRPPVPYLVGEWDQPPDAPIPDLTNETALRAWLVALPAGYCSAAKRSRWDVTLQWSDFEKTLQSSLAVLLGPDFKGFTHLTDIKVIKRDASGRVAELVLVTDKQRYTVAGDGVRWLTSGGHRGPGALNSSLFWVEIPVVPETVLTADVPMAVRTLTFHGGGWGHGVGLCQEGAAGRALAGQSYQDIVKHYYTGTVLETL